jgi:polysaccharide deacetylase family protein (PEP-CTERM system associated)
MSAAPVTNAITVDVEDWYQVSGFEDVVPRATWSAYASRVVRNTGLVLDVLASRRVRGTFFCLGHVARRHPALLREIRDRGHEIASHGFDHRLATTLSREAFRDDLRRAAAAIEDACGVVPRGYRAPSFSVSRDNLWVFDVLREEGYAFSSSVFPVAHDRYGIPDFPRDPVLLRGDDGRTLWELPMTTTRRLGRNLPVAGGGWMRLLPGAVMRAALRAENAAGRPVVVYLHPWELDPDQPRIAAASWRARWRHTLNLDRMRARLEALLDALPFGTVSATLAGLDPADPRHADPLARPAGLS